MTEFTSPELEIKECIIVSIEKVDDITGTYWALRYSKLEWLKRYPGNAMWYTSLKYDHRLKKGDKIRVWTQNYKVIKVEKIVPVIQVEILPAVVALGKTLLDGYNKYYIEDKFNGIIAIVPSDDDLYTPLVGLTPGEAYIYVVNHEDRFNKAHPAIRIGLLKMLNNDYPEDVTEKLKKEENSAR